MPSSGRRDRRRQGHPALAQRPARPPGAQLRWTTARDARGAREGGQARGSGASRISARTDGDLLAVTVEDDGRGIDPQRIRTAAVRKGILGEAAGGRPLGARRPRPHLPPGLLHPRGGRRDLRPRRRAGRGPQEGHRAGRLGGGRVGAGQGDALHAAHAPVALADEGAARPHRRRRLRHPGHRRGERRAARPRRHHRGGRHPRGPPPRPAPAGGGAGPAALAQRRPRDPSARRRRTWPTAPRGRRWWWTASSASARWRSRPPATSSRACASSPARRRSRTAGWRCSSPRPTSSPRRGGWPRPALSRGRDRRRLRILLVDDSAIAREAEAALLRSLGPRGRRGGRRRGRLAEAAGRRPTSCWSPTCRCRCSTASTSPGG